MKIYIITQSYNESNRIVDWIKYHKKIGIDHIFIFDDISMDNSIEVIEKYKNDTNDNSISVLLTDKKEATKAFKNPNEYGGNEEIHQRILRSYNRGLSLIRNGVNRYEKCVVFFIDVDEYLVPVNYNNIHKEMEDINFDKYKRFLVSSYDVKPPKDGVFNEDLPVYEQSLLTWSNDLRDKKGSFKNRTKIGVLASDCPSITSVHTGDLRTCEDWLSENCLILSHKYQKPVKGQNWTHDVINTMTGENWPCTNDIENEKTMIYSEFDRIKIYHFRNFPPSESINDEYDFNDNKIKNILND